MRRRFVFFPLLLAVFAFLAFLRTTRIRSRQAGADRIADRNRHVSGRRPGTFAGRVQCQIARLTESSRAEFPHQSTGLDHFLSAA
jgi:hypothetical protein